MLQKIVLAVLATIAVRHGTAADLKFIVTPPNITYAAVGSDVLLNWTYVEGSERQLWTQIFKTDAAGNKIGNDICSIIAGNNPELLNSNYTGRVSCYSVGSLFIYNVSLTDEGYMKYIVNYLPVGGYRKVLFHQIFLQVTIAPNVTNPLQKKTIVMVDTISELSCQFEARPAPTVKWLLNNAEMKNSRYNINTTTIGIFQPLYRVVSILTINVTQPEDVGNITCVGLLPNGNNVSSSTDHVVYYKPYIVASSPSIVYINASNTMTLFCDIRSSPATNSIHWLSDKKSINATNHAMALSSIIASPLYAIEKTELTITNASRFDTGLYSCEASNAIGNLTKNVTLIVYYPPELTCNFGHQQNLTESSTIVKFTCTVESHPISMIHWYKDGSRYTLNINDTVKVSTDIKSVIESSLVFPAGINRTDFGVYTCNASNELGIASYATDVTVWYGPEFRSNLTGQLDIMELKNTTFECTIEGYPAPVIEWHKNGKKLMHSKYQMTTTTLVSTANRIVKKSVINFVKVVENDTAEYTCKGSNVVGMKMQRKKLNVLFLPKLLVPSSNVTANQSNPVSLHCLTNANPPVLRYNWTKDGNSLSETGSTYSIASAQHLSTGAYACTPINSLGSHGTLVFNLVVNIPPSFTQQADCKPNRVTNKMVCQCSGTGVPFPSVFWTKQPNTTIIGTGNTYERDLISRNVDGKYNCHLKNLLKEVISTTGFYHYVNPTTEWASWEACNETCGQGYEFRRRTCNFPPCDEHLVENRTCIVPCTPEKLKKDEAWAIALYVLIPILVVLLAIILLWCARTKKRKEEQTPIVVPVNGNLSKPPSTRSMQTRRNIYLPENTFATMNPGYLEEEKETPRRDDVYIDMDTKQFDSLEAELKFEEEYPVDSSTDEATENPTSARSSIEDGVKSPVPDLLINGQVESKEQALEQEQQADDEVDTYLGPDNTEVPYSFYNEMSTAL